MSESESSRSKIWTKKVSEPWFSFIKNGSKKVEGRLLKDDFKLMRVGDMIKFTNTDGNKAITVKITNLKHYDNFLRMIKSETVENVLPGVETIDDAVGVYKQFYTDEKIKKYGVIAIHIRLTEKMINQKE